jgi:hypothetical protein
LVGFGEISKAVLLLLGRDSIFYPNLVCFVKRAICVSSWHRYIQLNDLQQNDTKHNEMQQSKSQNLIKMFWFIDYFAKFIDLLENIVLHIFTNLPIYIVIKLVNLRL